LSLIRKDYYVNRSKMLSFLADLPERPADAVTIYLSPGQTRDEFISQLGLATGDRAREIADIAVSSQTGICLFWGVVKRIIYPPFPIKDNVAFSGYAKNPLFSMLMDDRTIAVVLIRLGAYGLGLCRDENLVVSKVGTGLVHGRHRQGGSSAQRFRRHREKQIEQFLIRVCERVYEYLVPELGNIDYIVYGGARTTIELLRKECPVLESLQDRVLPPLLDIADPRQSVLEASVRRIWSSRVIEWEERT
jgi:hypothetical protein